MKLAEPFIRPRLIRVILFSIIIGVPAALLVAKLSRVLVTGEVSLPIYGSVSNFILTEKSGKPFSLGDLKGKRWVASFMFTSCSGLCPMVNQEINRLQKLLPPDIRFVSFTVDPERDTPRILSSYAKGFEADDNRWFFLTGAKETLNRVTTSFHMSAIDNPSLHSLKLVLVDQNAQIRGYYDSSDQEAMKKLLADAKKLR